MSAGGAPSMLARPSAGRAHRRPGADALVRSTGFRQNLSLGGVTSDTLPGSMAVWWRRLLPLMIVVVCAVATTAAVARTAPSGPLTGMWSGVIAGGGARQHIVIVVNAGETAGSWKLGATCYGPLKLDSISKGYHHFLRKRGRGARCSGGDIDCLKRAGANVYDAVTSRPGGGYDVSGTLHRARRT